MGDLTDGGDVGSRITSFKHLTGLSLSANLVHLDLAGGVAVAGVDVALESSHDVLGKLVWFQRLGLTLSTVQPSGYQR